MKREVKCEYCKKPFWSSVRKSYIIIAKKKVGKNETRVVKGASLDKGKADKQASALRKEYKKTKEYDTADVEKQLTIKKTMCQRCRNMVNQLKNRQVSMQSKRKKQSTIREIPKEDVIKMINAQINRKIVEDYRAKAKREAREKQLAEIKKAREAKKKIIGKATEKLENVEGKTVIEESLGDDRRKSA